MRLLVNYVTDYRYTAPQRRLVQLARVVPASFTGQTVVDWSVDVGCDARMRVGRDGYGNETRMIYVDGPIDRLALTVAGEVLTEDRAGVVQGAPEPLPPLVFLRTTPLTAADAAITTMARHVHHQAHGTLDRMHLLMSALHAGLRFDAERTIVTRTAAEAWAGGHGVCQDYAHIFLAAARAMDVPARYVSGHLYREGGERQPAAHAWVEACVEDLGWVGFDPTNGVCPDDAYVRVAVGLDYREAAPLAGARVGGGIERLEVGVSVVRPSARQGQSQSQSQS